MTLPVPAVLAGVVVLVVLALGLARVRAGRAKLLRRLEAVSGELQSLQASFSRFAPPAVIEQVIANGTGGRGEKKEVTVLFADLVGFTKLSESVEPTALVRILNGYFERMSRAIAVNRGHVTTLIGDGILAFFGALEPNPWQADDAARAALAMKRELREYDRELAAAGLPTLELGIGLHRGIGVAGLVGSRDLMQFALVGRVVNVAARVQDLTRHHDVDLIVTEAVAKTLAPEFRVRELPPSLVKGIEDPLVIYALEGIEVSPRHSLRA
jgi:class 3 adenylate cyclase